MSWRERERVAQDPATPVSVLVGLVDDGAFRVRFALAGNPSTPSSVLMRLGEDADRWVRFRVVHHPALPFRSLLAFAFGADGDNEVAAYRHLWSLDDADLVARARADGYEVADDMPRDYLLSMFGVP